MENKEQNIWKTVEATQEGLIEGVTSVGLRIREKSIFVALPSVKALWRIVAVKYEDKFYLAPVLDVGPWNEGDDAYVFGEARPRSEQGIGKYRTPTNDAGIDLSDGLISLMGIEPRNWGKREVSWRFVSPSDFKT